MSLTRRQLFQNTGTLLSLTLLESLFPGLSFADDRRTSPGSPTAGQCFVLLRTFGGMDATLGLDPQVRPAGADEQDIFLEYRPEDIKEVAGLRLGPAAVALAPFAAECAIVNGIMMRRDAGHDPLNLYMLSGRGDSKAASLPVELASCGAAGPYGVVMNASTFTGPRNVILSATSDLQTASTDGTLLELLEEEIRAMGASGTPLANAQGAILKAKPATTRLVQILKDFEAQDKTLTDKHVLAAALGSGATFHAQYDIGLGQGNLDTHFAHPKTHLALQTQVWQQVAEVFSIFKRIPYGQGTLFDATTFMVMSEFSRTPNLNVGQGKDHNPYTNSCLLAGRGIRTGRVFGLSRVIPRTQSETGEPLHIAAPWDFAANQPAPSPQGAQFFFPENVIRSLSLAFGDPAGFASVAKTTPPIPGLAR